MTLAPSRRLRSSGNSFLALALLLALTLLSSCGIFRKSPTQPPVSEAPPKKEIEVPSSSEPPTPAKPEVIKIAYLLPFNTDEIPFDTAGNVTKKLNESTKLSLDYYRGAMMALDTVQKAGVKIKAHAFDTTEDSLKVQSIFNKPEVRESHLVIGPVYVSQLQVAAPLARNNKTYMLSPFSTVNSFVDHNPYYILANSSLSTHCEMLYDYAVEHGKPTRVLMLYNDNETEKQYAQYFINRNTRVGSPALIISLTDLTEVSYDKVEIMLEDTVTNVVIVPSVNESFVSGVVRKLASLSDKYEIQLYGMPQWRDFRNVSATNLSKLQTRITASMWFDRSEPAIQQFSDRYTKRYGSAPSEISLEGYNQTLFFASLMAVKGHNFEKFLPDYGMTTAGENFHFEIMRRTPLVGHTESTNAPPFDFIENRSVHILEYKAGKAVKIK